MTQTLPEPAQVKLALAQIADARERLRLASDVLKRVRRQRKPWWKRHLPSCAKGGSWRLGIRRRIFSTSRTKSFIRSFPSNWRRERFSMAHRPRDWLYRVYAVSCIPRSITEPVATIVVMLAAVKFGLRHQLLLQTETRLGHQHKTPITQLDLFLETFISEMVAADLSDVRFNDWLKQTVIDHYPDFRNNRRLNLPNGDYILIPNEIKPIEHMPPAPLRVAALYTSPLDPTSNTLIPPGSGYRIEQRHGDILEDDDHPPSMGSITRDSIYRAGMPTERRYTQCGRAS